MGVTVDERSTLEELTAARLRGAKPDELLELSEAAIDQATAAGGTLGLEAIAVELDLAAAACPVEGDRLRLQLAARHARAIVPPPRALDASDDVPVPVAARAAFWLTVALLALTLVLFGAIAALGDVGASYLIVILIGLVAVLGGLVVAVLGVAGFRQSARLSSSKGMLMSAVPCAIVLLLIAIRIGVSVF